MDKILEIKNLKKIYHNLNGETEAIDDISFDLYEGEFIAIVGPSGCGKSTLLSILCNLEDKSSGEINIKNKKLGYMLQDDSLFEWRNILDNSLLGLEIKNAISKESVEYTKNLLRKYGLKDFMQKKPSNLSGGMRQRVALIRTLATKPDILILDEPFSALDYQSRLSVSDYVYKIINSENKSAIIVTHDIAEAISMADKVIVLTKRPCKIKNIYQINLSNKSTPIENRKSKEFLEYYDLIWKDIEKDE